MRACFLWICLLKLVRMTKCFCPSLYLVEQLLKCILIGTKLMGFVFIKIVKIILGIWKKSKASLFKASVAGNVWHEIAISPPTPPPTQAQAQHQPQIARCEVQIVWFNFIIYSFFCLFAYVFKIELNWIIWSNNLFILWSHKVTFIMRWTFFYKKPIPEYYIVY